MGKILLAAIDQSPQHRQVLDKAAEIAAYTGAELHVVSVNDLGRHHEVGFAAPTAEMIAAIDGEVRAGLAEASAYLAHRGVACRTHAPYGATAEQISLLAKRLRADGIIIGHRHLSWLGRLVEGSVGSDLLARAPCNVLIVVEPTAADRDDDPCEPLSRPA